MQISSKELDGFQDVEVVPNPMEGGGTVSVPPEYLLNVSRDRLEDFILLHRNISQNLRKEAREALIKWAEEAAMAMLGEWLRENGEALVVLVTAPPKETASLAIEAPPARTDAGQNVMPVYTRFYKARSGT